VKVFCDRFCFSERSGVAIPQFSLSHIMLVTPRCQGYAYAGQMDEVARLLNEMQPADVAPTDTTLAALADR
jgi:hypothetical protein